MKYAVSLIIVIVTFVILVGSYSKTLPLSLEYQNMDIVRLSILAYNDGDWSSFSNLHSPIYLHHAPDHNEPISLVAYELSCRIAHRRLPDLQYRIKDIFCVSDKVACRLVWEYHCYSDHFLYRFPDGIIQGSLISISLIKDGKIIEEWLEYDPVCVNELIHFAKRMEHIK
ncbi:hypothetical protein ES703_79650 [subsurface metagenome]